MLKIREQFEDKVQVLNEAVARGRGVQAFKGIRKDFKEVIKRINFDYLNRSTGNIANKPTKYNFNNYYTLDIRIDVDKLTTIWEDGQDLYEGIFQNSEQISTYENNLLVKLRREFSKFYNNLEAKAALKAKGINLEPFHQQDGWWESLEDAKSNSAIAAIYADIPIISIFEVKGKDQLAIKVGEFTDLIIKGLASASRGHVPQGVTIEEILEGKFSRKAITPEQGTFINRVKDPTSDKDFNFRSWDANILKELHDLIMDTFKYDPKLKVNVAELEQLGGVDKSRSSLFLYMSQDDFNKFEKGGKGLRELGKGALDYMQSVGGEELQGF